MILQSQCSLVQNSSLLGHCGIWIMKSIFEMHWVVEHRLGTFVCSMYTMILCQQNLNKQTNWGTERSKRAQCEMKPDKFSRWFCTVKQQLSCVPVHACIRKEEPTKKQLKIGAYCIQSIKLLKFFALDVQHAISFIIPNGLFFLFIFNERSEPFGSHSKEPFSSSWLLCLELHLGHERYIPFLLPQRTTQ